MSRGAMLAVVVVVGAAVVGGTVYGLNARSGSKSKPKTKATTAKPKPPSLVPVCALDVTGTVSKEFTWGDTQASESYDLTTVVAKRKGVGLEGAYSGRGITGTFEGTGQQAKLNTTMRYKGKVAGGTIAFSLTDSGMGILSGSGTLSLKCTVTEGTATNKYGTKPIKKTTSTVVVPIKVTVEGSSGTVKAEGGHGSLIGTFAPPKD